MSISSITSAVEQLVEQHAIPGLSAACVFEDDHVETYVFGWADRQNQEKMTSRHRMLAGSVGKTFTSATMLVLAQEGKINLDDLLAKWLEDEPWFSGLANSSSITLRMLLNHTSGLADHREVIAFTQALSKELLGKSPNYDLYFNPTELVNFIIDEPARFKPGSAYAYSETGYILAGLIIEKASGTNYYELVKSHFLDRFHLKDTEAANSRNLSNLAQGYFGPNDVGLPQYSLSKGHLSFNPASEWTGGGFVSTASDLARWAKLLFQEKALNAPYLNDLLTTPSVSEHQAYGLGTYIWHTPHGEAYGHTGDQIGYRSVMAYYPRFKTALSVQINSTVPTRDDFIDVLGVLADALFLK